MQKGVGQDLIQEHGVVRTEPFIFQPDDRGTIGTLRVWVEVRMLAKTSHSF